MRKAMQQQTPVERTVLSRISGGARCAGSHLCLSYSKGWDEVKCSSRNCKNLMRFHLTKYAGCGDIWLSSQLKGKHRQEDCGQNIPLEKKVRPYLKSNESKKGLCI
jgi:hypothetical protein